MSRANAEKRAIDLPVFTVPYIPIEKGGGIQPRGVAHRDLEEEVGEYLGGGGDGGPTGLPAGLGGPTAAGARGGAIAWTRLSSFSPMAATTEALQ